MQSEEPIHPDVLSQPSGLPPPNDLGPYWIADDGAFYYLFQDGQTLWWVGLSNDGDLQHGLTFSNVFQGQVSGSVINGMWANVPRGITTGQGTLSLMMQSSSQPGSPFQLKKTAESGGFSASLWSQIAPPPVDKSIHDVFDAVKKNQNAFRDHSLLDNLKNYKDHAVVFGTVLPDEFQLPWHINYPSNAGRTYRDFICLDNNNSPPDGDLNIPFQIDRAQLNRQTNFWTDGWDTNPGDIRAKLDDLNNVLHLEVIMFGQTAECGDDPSTFNNPPLLPGWQEANGNSVLLNGQPISGNVGIGPQVGGSYSVNSVLGMTIAIGTSLRVTGVLVLDCGHGITRPCDESDRTTHNQEIHPVYAIDIINPTPSDDLSGVWADDDGRTYYVRQFGVTLWWLGMGPFRDHTFGRVFLGTVQNQTINGQWADVPLGQGQSSGSMTLQVDSGTLTLVTNPGSPTESRWIKLYNAQGTGGFHSLRRFLEAKGVNSVRSLQPTGSISLRTLMGL